MDNDRRRVLKQEGKRLVEENSARVQKELYDRNPYPVGHSNWVKNIFEEYSVNRRSRQNKTDVISETEALKYGSVKVLGFDFEKGFMPHAGWYVLCQACRHLVPTNAELPLACRCGVAIDPIKKSAALPTPDRYGVVEIVGRGSLRHSTKPWWKFW